MRNKNLIYQPNGCIFGCNEFHEYASNLEDLIYRIQSGNKYYISSPYHIISIFNHSAPGVSHVFEYDSIDDLRMQLSSICRYRELIVSPEFDEIYEEICYFEFEDDICVGQESNIMSFDLGLIHNQYDIPDTGMVSIKGFTNAADWPKPINTTGVENKVGYLDRVSDICDISGIYKGLDENIGCSVYPYFEDKTIGDVSFEEASNFTIPLALLSEL